MGNRKALLLAFAVGLAGCSREQPRQQPAKDTAEQMSKLATDPKQAELWKQAASRAQVDLKQIPVADRPIQTRQRAVASSRAAESKAVTLPKEQSSAVRILSVPDLPDGAYSGNVRIARVEAERVDLDLGENRILSLLLRIRMGGLRAKAGDAAQLELRLRDEPHNRGEVLALKASDGDGIVTVLEGGTRPVTVHVALFALTASQVAKPENGTMPVQVTIGEERQILRQGQIAEFKAGLSVGIVASLAVMGQDANREEGNPYAIRLLAWPRR